MKDIKENIELFCKESELLYESVVTAEKVQYLNDLWCTIVEQLREQPRIKDWD